MWAHRNKTDTQGHLRPWAFEQIDCILNSEELTQEQRDRLRAKLIALLRTDRGVVNDHLQSFLGVAFEAILTVRQKLERWAGDR